MTTGDIGTDSAGNGWMFGFGTTMKTFDIIVSHHGSDKGVQCTLDLDQFMDAATGEADLGKVLIFMAEFLPKTGPTSEGRDAPINVPIE